MVITAYWWCPAVVVLPAVVLTNRTYVFLM
jgi:hypothetical protein